MEDILSHFRTTMLIWFPRELNCMLYRYVHSLGTYKIQKKSDAYCLAFRERLPSGKPFSFLKFNIRHPWAGNIKVFLWNIKRLFISQHQNDSLRNYFFRWVDVHMSSNLVIIFYPDKYMLKFISESDRFIVKKPFFCEFIDALEEILRLYENERRLE